MDPVIIEGKISFVHHDKDYVTIDYTQNGKKKSINGKVDKERQLNWIKEKLVKKIHQFHEGDVVFFTIARSARGDKMVAERIQYRFNNALGNLINRSKTDNKFVGYLKLVDGNFFVKETGSYLFFPVVLSPWELPPDIHKLNEPVFFQLQNTDQPEKLEAVLLKHRFIPEYAKAQKYLAEKKIIEGKVYKITPHGIYVNVIGEKIRAKIPLSKKEATVPSPELKVGDTLNILIRFLSSTKIAIVAA
jgi:ribosomal protein S1